jgi:hypothetical protein
MYLRIKLMGNWLGEDGDLSQHIIEVLKVGGLASASTLAATHPLVDYIAVKQGCALDSRALSSG